MRLQFVLPLIIFTGCANLAPRVLQQKSLRLKNDQTKEEVIAILGQPKNNSFKGKFTAWQFCETSHTGSAQDFYLIVWFYDDRTIGLTHYSGNGRWGSCESFFQAIRWDEIPNSAALEKN